MSPRVSWARREDDPDLTLEVPTRLGQAFQVGMLFRFARADEDPQLYQVTKCDPTGTSIRIDAHAVLPPPTVLTR